MNGTSVANRCNHQVQSPGASKYFLNQHRYSRNQGIIGKLVERQIFLKFQVSV